MRILAVLGTALATLALFGMFPLAPAKAAETGQLAFSVLRKGDIIGFDNLKFHSDANRLDVEVETDIAVKIAFIPVYHLKHSSRELWEGASLKSLWSHTDDDGKIHDLSVREDNGRLLVDGDKQISLASPTIVPASLWNERILRSDQLLNTLTGEQMAVQITIVGPDSVLVKGQPVPATHYVITGDLKRELWFDARQTLVQVRFKADDDSEITYSLR